MAFETKYRWRVRLRHWRKEHAFLSLSISLFAILLLLPFFTNNMAGYLLFELLYLDALLMGLSATGRLQPRTKWVMVILWALGIALTLLAYNVLAKPAQVWASQAGSLVHLAILCVCIATMLLYVLATRRVVAETLFAAVSVYLFLAIAWGQLYMVLSRLDPGAFRPTAASEGANALEMLYFSLTTITTLGYGDVVPLTSFSRMLSVCEALTGQLFLAMLVAWLVGMFLSEKRRQPPEAASKVSPGSAGRGRDGG